MCRNHPLLTTLVLFALASASAAQAAERRLALVIGNADYKNATPLINTLNDARDMAERLDALGFEVTKLENAGRKPLSRAIGRFLQHLRQNDGVGLFYYSGHGLQVGGKNYLVPVDAEIESEWDVRSDAVAVDTLLDGMTSRDKDAVNLVILDACRNNPYERGGRSIGGKGLARIETPPGGTLILYATRPGETASDNPKERNGLFTKHLLKVMQEPGVPVEVAFKQVAKGVYAQSNYTQYPWPEGIILRPFYFLPPVAPVVPSVVVVPPPPPPPSVRLGWLQVTVDVPDALVSVNGRPVGNASPGKPLNLATGLPEGEVTIRVQARGQTQQRKETIHANQWTPAWFGFAQATPAGPEGQLATCAAHFKANRLTTGKGGNAADCYASVLQRYPGNQTALEGLAAIEEKYQAWAESALERGEPGKARVYVGRMAKLNPENPVVARLQTHIELKETEIASTQSQQPEPIALPTPDPLPPRTPQLLSCRSILDAGRSKGDGIYTIVPDGIGGTNSFPVYCDMTTDGGGWTIVAKSTNPSMWNVSNEYALSHYNHWIDKDNYTYDYRRFLPKLTNGKPAEIRIYDPIIPTDMDIRYELTAHQLSKLLSVDLDDENRESTEIPATITKKVFLESRKAVTATQRPEKYFFFRLHQQDSYSAEYCSGERTKSAINIINTGGCRNNGIQTTICSSGLGYNQHAARGQCGVRNYNRNDQGKRLAIAFRETR